MNQAASLPTVLLAALIASAGGASGAVLTLPEYHYAFHGELDADLGSYPAGTPVGFEIAGTSANWIESPPGSGPEHRTTYRGFSGRFWLGGDSFAGAWTVDITNSYFDPAINTTISSFGVELVGDPRFNFFLGYEEFGGPGNITSTALPLLGGNLRLFAAMNIDQVNLSTVTPVAFASTRIPEPGWLALLAPGGPVLGRRRRPPHTLLKSPAPAARIRP